jgi:hypothetical protein
MVDLIEFVNFWSAEKDIVGNLKPVRGIGVMSCIEIRIFWCYVAPRAGAWIETIMFSWTVRTSESHLVRVRALKCLF